MKVPIIDLEAGYQAQKEAIDSAVAEVLSSGWYILGENVKKFEAEFADHHGCSYAVGVATGTDAIILALRAFNIGPGDEVITVSHTAVATVAAIKLTGARPVLVDIDPQTYTMSPEALSDAITARTKAVIPVHLYGQPADMDAILDVTNREGVTVIEDCAQAHGAKYRDQLVGSIGDAGTFSFYPTKNLGAIGDGGAVTCHGQKIADRLRSLRQYGWQQRYISEEVGFNSRLDELQGAILSVKLQTLDADNQKRRQIAQFYDHALAGTPLKLPTRREERYSVYHLYVIQSNQRDSLQAFLKGKGIGSAVHYPEPVHLQPAYRNLGYRQGAFPITEQAAQEVLSLPMYPQMSENHLQHVVKSIREYFGVD